MILRSSGGREENVRGWIGEGAIVLMAIKVRSAGVEQKQQRRWKRTWFTVLDALGDAALPEGARIEVSNKIGCFRVSSDDTVYLCVGGKDDFWQALKEMLTWKLGSCDSSSTAAMSVLWMPSEIMRRPSFPF
jgi:hypothetical protein